MLDILFSVVALIVGRLVYMLCQLMAVKWGTAGVVAAAA